MVQITALPLFRAKRGGEEEGRALDLFELSSSHYGRMKSRVVCRIGVEIRCSLNNLVFNQLFVCAQNELRFACQYFILGPMLMFPSHIPSFPTTSRVLLSCSLTSLLSPKKTAMHRDIMSACFV